VGRQLFSALLDRLGVDQDEGFAPLRILPTVLHRMWVDGSEFRWSKDDADFAGECNLGVLGGCG
jgi:hypothetical protein